MKKRSLQLFVVSIAALASHPLLSMAETPIQAFVNSEGRIVYTNAFETPKPTAAPPPPAPASPGSGQGTVAKEGTTESIMALVHQISSSHGVDPQLVSAVMKVESNYDRWARSSKGALGLMQLIPATGRRFGVQDFFDPHQNIEGGVRYLKFLLEKFDGNIDLSLAAYNAGENLVARLGRIPAITETRNYVRKIRAIYQKSSSPVESRDLAAGKPEKVTPEANVIFRNVDERGVVRFSNIAPSN